MNLSYVVNEASSSSEIAVEADLRRSLRHLAQNYYQLNRRDLYHRYHLLFRFDVHSAHHPVKTAQGRFYLKFRELWPHPERL
jgi:hypothetical protein